jgi:hypothetical protein
MAPQLPPDLQRLGDTLTEATARAAVARRRPARLARRLAACLAAGMAVFAAMAPSSLGPAQRATEGLLELAAVENAYGAGPLGPCDPPHGAAAHCLEESPHPQVR